MTHQPVNDIPHDPARERQYVHARQARAARKALVRLMQADMDAALEKAKEVPDVKN